MCQYCENEYNDFVLLNETASYSDIEIALNRQGVLRVRTYDGDGWSFVSQDIINVKYCPMCGRKFER